MGRDASRDDASRDDASRDDASRDDASRNDASRNDASRNKGGDQAAWRDLVARLELPSPVDPATAPWPERENLRPGPPSATAGADGTRPARPGDPASESDRRAARGRVVRPADPGQAGGRPVAAGQPDSPGSPHDDLLSDVPTSPEVSFIDFLDEVDDPDDPDSCYTPPSLPPSPRLDPVTKGAWVALFGGPCYLLLATMLGWQLPGWAKLLAVVAFVTGFVVLVTRLGDGPSRKDGPDQGAVV